MNWARSTSLFAFLLLFVIMGCRGESSSESNSPQASRQVAVAAAADLKFAFDELIGEFEKVHPDIKAQVTYESSGNFFAQLSNKAPFDIFFSADIVYPRQLVEQGLANKESEFLYAVGQIVVWGPNDSPIDVERPVDLASRARRAAC